MLHCLRRHYFSQMEPWSYDHLSLNILYDIPHLRLPGGIAPVLASNEKYYPLEMASRVHPVESLH